MAALRALKASLARCSRWSAASRRSGLALPALPKVRGVFLRSGSGRCVSLYGRDGRGCRVGAARRMVGASLPARSRLHDERPQQQCERGTRSAKRAARCGVRSCSDLFAAAAAGLAAYALAPNHHDDRPSRCTGSCNRCRLPGEDQGASEAAESGATQAPKPVAAATPQTDRSAERAARRASATRRWECATEPRARACLVAVRGRRA